MIVANVNNSSTEAEFGKMQLYFRNNCFKIEYSFKSYKLIFLEDREKSTIKNLFITLLFAFNHRAILVTNSELDKEKNNVDLKK